MPEKTLVKEASLDANTNDPLQKVQVLIDKKIRNLEKRKGKLDSYKKEKADGKKLDAQQVTALEKYDDVLENLNFLKDFSKSVTQIQEETAKEKKKQEKEEQSKRFLEDKEKLKTLLIFQEVFKAFDERGQELRDTLIKGGCGLKPIKEQRLNNVLSLRDVVLPDSRKGTEPFDQQVDGAASKLVFLIEGKRKEVVKGTTFAEAKDVLLTIHSSGVLYSHPNGQGDEKVCANQSSSPAPQSELVAPGQSSVYSFGTVGGVEARPEQDPAVISIYPSFASNATNGAIPSQIFTNASFATYVPVTGAVVQGGHILPTGQIIPGHFTQAPSHPTNEQNQIQQTADETNNNFGLQNLNLNDGRVQLQNQGDSEFKAKDNKRSRFQVQGNRRDNDRKHFDHHGSTNGFQRKQDRYRSSTGHEGKKPDRPFRSGDRPGFQGKGGPRGERQLNGPPKSGGNNNLANKQWT